MKRVDLCEEQESAADALCEWARWRPGQPRGRAGARGPEDDRVRALRGLAGTGKTVTAAEVATRLAADGTRVAVVAPTGKAAHVLRTKGIGATTIHAFQYVLVDEGADGPRFELRDQVTGDPDVVICDEASMCTRSHLDDLLARVPKVVLVGDPGQLPPVSGQPVLADALGIDLTEVHRQALDSGVIRFAHAIRSGLSVADALRAGAPDVVAGRPRHLVGALLVARNDHRVRLNAGVRAQVHAAKYGRTVPAWPVVGDRVVCLSNHRGRTAGDRDRRSDPYGNVGHLGHDSDPWCNGTVGDVVYVDPSGSRDATGADAMRSFVALCDDGHERIARAWVRQLTAPGLLSVDEWDAERRQARYAWGWVLTTHKAQGSEWDEVAVVGDGFGTPDEIRAWRYTAATRAAKKLWWWST